MALFDVIALDADDTLWHNEHLYRETKDLFVQVLREYGSLDWIQTHLFRAETYNLQHYGYGIKSFTLSMIETAIELSGGKVSGTEILALINQAKKMVAADVELVQHAAESVAQVSKKYPLMLITKGDLFEQDNKIARSGLKQFFKYVEVVSEKNKDSYDGILQRYSIPPGRFLMVGNSSRSDILPILELGGKAVYIPYATTWQHENVELPSASWPGYYQIEHIGLLPDLLERLECVAVE
jgi:putative hydrolase of the HAD superfamily